MQKELTQPPLVSVIIPCFNAEKYLAATIQSVISQDYSNIEILCINDGSTDNTEQIIKGINDNRISYIYKKNSGVSDTRNHGIQLSKGNYIVFLDSDDIFEKQYISKRVELLEKDEQYGFCASNVIKINEQGVVIARDSRGPYDSSLLEEILLYKDKISTCPSIFMIRKKVLTTNNIIFNTRLSSSADRFFLIELSKHTAGIFIREGAELYYRIHSESMSHKLTIKLIDDNKQYYRELKKKKYIPEALNKEFSFKINYIFAGSYNKLKKIIPCLWYSAKAFYYSPSGFFKQLKN